MWNLDAPNVLQKFRRDAPILASVKKSIVPWALESRTWDQKRKIQGTRRQSELGITNNTLLLWLDLPGLENVTEKDAK